MLQTLPPKSDFKGLALLKQDTAALTRKKFNSQSEKLKAYYESKGYPYLLPHQEWSDKKILDTVDLLGNDLNELIKSKTLNKQTLQEAIKKLAPETKGKILIKDFGDLEKYLRASGESESMIEHYMTNCGAMTHSRTDKTMIFLKFENADNGEWPRIVFKGSVKREVKHALSATLQNTYNMNLYKNDVYKCTKKDPIFNQIFNLFQGKYYKGPDWTKKEITGNAMARWLGFSSTESLHKDFEKTFNNLTTEAKSVGVLDFGDDKKGWKQLYKYSKDFAKNEKEAYQSNTACREYFGDLKTPTAAELKPLIYEEMEKFFAQKRIQANKEIPNP